MNKDRKQLGIPYDQGGCLAIQQDLWPHSTRCPAWTKGGCPINQIETQVINSRTREWWHQERNKVADDWGNWS